MKEFLEFLRSPAGTFFFFLVGAGPFLMSGLGSFVRWRPGLTVLGELLLALIAGAAWATSNLLAAWMLGFAFLSSLGMIAVGWWKHRQS